MKWANWLKTSTLLLLWVVSIAVWAASSPLATVQDTANQALAALKANEASLKTNPKVVYDIINRILLPRVDTQGMARSALGRDAWTNATPAQRKQFTDEFIKLLVRTYSSALASYTDEQVKFLPPRTDANSQGRAQIDSLILQPNGPSIPVSYRLILQGSEWKVYDFSVDGISILESFRSQFADQLSQGNLNALIQQLAQHNQQKQAGQ